MAEPRPDNRSTIEQDSNFDRPEDHSPSQSHQAKKVDSKAMSRDSESFGQFVRRESGSQEIQELQSRLEAIFTIPDPGIVSDVFDEFEAYRQMARMKMSNQEYAKARKWLSMAESLRKAVKGLVEGARRSTTELSGIYIPNFDGRTGKELTTADKVAYVQKNYPNAQIPNFNPYTGQKLDTPERQLEYIESQYQ